MKKQAQKATKTKKTTKAAAAEVAWDIRAQGLPLALFHTTIGPIIGRVENAAEPDAGPFSIRLWAPAAIRMGYQPGQPGALVAQYAVTFQPIALIETYLDLSAETPFGRSPVPSALVPAYEAYFAKVAAGEYSFARSTAHVEQAMPHEAPIAEGEPLAENATPAFPWPEGSETETDRGSDYYDWLTRKVYSLSDEEALDRDDVRRTLVKRSLTGWAFDAQPQKVAASFDFDVNDVMFAYKAFDDTFLGAETDKARIRKLLSPPTRVEQIDEESSLS